MTKKKSPDDEEDEILLEGDELSDEGSQNIDFIKEFIE